MLQQLAGDQAVLARLPNYLTDAPFAGQFDPNPYYEKDREIMPRSIAALPFHERQRTPEEEWRREQQPARVAGVTDTLLRRLLGKRAAQAPAIGAL